MFTYDDYKYAMKHPDEYDSMREDAFTGSFWTVKNKLYNLSEEEQLIKLMTNYQEKTRIGYTALHNSK